MIPNFPLDHTLVPRIPLDPTVTNSITVVNVIDIDPKVVPIFTEVIITVIPLDLKVVPSIPLNHTGPLTRLDNTVHSALEQQYCLQKMHFWRPTLACNTC